MIHRIAALDDPRLESYRHVADASWLRRRELFVAEGRLVVSRLIALERHRIESVLVTHAARDAMRDPLARVDADVYVCDQRTLSGITGYNFHRGCLALAARPPALSVDDFRAASRLVALEGVGNPDNVGGLFRTAAAFGADGILLGPGTGDPLYRKALRTSMGAALRLPYAQLENWPEALIDFQERGFQLVALTPHPDAPPLAEFAADRNPSERLMLLLGSEGAGLDARTLALADARVRIPIDPQVDSLNVVVAASIALERLR